MDLVPEVIFLATYGQTQGNLACKEENLHSHEQALQGSAFTAQLSLFTRTMLRAIHGQCTPNSIAVCENLKLPRPGDSFLCGCADFTVVVLPLICVRSPEQVTLAERCGGFGTLNVYGGRQL
jgi:hypothetical protein